MVWYLCLGVSKAERGNEVNRKRKCSLCDCETYDDEPGSRCQDCAALILPPGVPRGKRRSNDPLFNIRQQNVEQYRLKALRQLDLFVE